MHPSIIVTVVVVVVVALQVIASRVTSGVQAKHIVNSNDVSLKTICAGDGGGGGGQQLTSGQVISLANQLKQAGAGCPAHIKAAILDMNDILTKHSADICTNENAQAIVIFYIRHLRKEATRTATIPKSLEAFALAYAMRTNQQCKLNMIKVFTSSEPNSALKPRDFEALSKWTRKGGDIARLMGLIAEPGAIVIPSDLAALLPEDDEIMGRLVIRGSTLYVENDIKHIKEVCLRRFKPVYTGLVEPVAALSRAGFDYPDKLIKDDLSAGQLDKHAADRLEEWSRIVFLCETLDFVRSLGIDSDDSDAGSFKGVDEDEDAVEFVDALDYLDDLNEIDQALVEAAQIQAQRPRLAMGEVAPLPAGQLKQLIYELGAQETNMDLFKARLIRSKQQILRELEDEPHAEERGIGASASFGRRLVGSIQQRDGIAWSGIIKKMGVAAVLMAAIIKMPLGPPGM